MCVCVCLCWSNRDFLCSWMLFFCLSLSSRCACLYVIEKFSNKSHPAKQRNVTLNKSYCELHHENRLLIFGRFYFFRNMLEKRSTEANVEQQNTVFMGWIRTNGLMALSLSLFLPFALFLRHDHYRFATLATSYHYLDDKDYKDCLCICAHFRF